MQIIFASRYATKKLMETTNEFQKQSELNKKLQRALAEALAEKDRHDRNLKADSEPKVNLISYFHYHCNF